ncbi:hypothetical protein SKAU_G00343520 [Synaphobranchus kaupii]|uniref:Uncharacterized protein n=1 Tax=Synaphobranchus kaupii TaxID=118154 RepID=A0A9Q1IHH5_SYNKA|nr:hypothetical protein SKAU_G00343520 [Synaphobranchus kaupii]
MRLIVETAPPPALSLTALSPLAWPGDGCHDGGCFDLWRVCRRSPDLVPARNAQVFKCGQSRREKALIERAALSLHVRPGLTPGGGGVGVCRFVLANYAVRRCAERGRIAANEGPEPNVVERGDSGWAGRPLCPMHCRASDYHHPGLLQQRLLEA